MEMNRKRGSITVFLCILMPGILIILLVLGDYSYFRYQREKWVADGYLRMDHALSEFDEKLFDEMGLLAVETLQTQGYLDPLSELEYLEKSIHHIMEYRSLLDGVNLAESKASEFLSSITGVEFSLLDVNSLNQDLYRLVDKLASGDSPEIQVEKFIARMVSMSPYVKLKGMSLNALRSHLRNLEFEEILAVRPVFVLKDEISESYSIVLEVLRKYASFLVDSYMRGDYGIDYVGYSMTSQGSDGLRSEYLVTGFENKEAKDIYIRAELYALRLTLNFIETFSNPQLRDKIMKVTGGEPRLYAVVALGLSIVEASLDVTDILNRKVIPLYKGSEGFQSLSFGFKNYSKGWDYPDYLRIMLMLVPRDTYLTRMQHLIEHNYELDVSTLYTRVELEEKMSYKGRFIPWTLKGHFKGTLSYIGDPSPSKP